MVQQALFTEFRFSAHEVSEVTKSIMLR